MLPRREAWGTPQGYSALKLLGHRVPVAFREYSGRLAGILREHSGNDPGVGTEHFGSGRAAFLEPATADFALRRRIASVIARSLADCSARYAVG
jgi:hypothetical protein